MQTFLESKKQKDTNAHNDTKTIHDQIKLQNFKANYDANSNAFQRLVENFDLKIKL